LFAKYENREGVFEKKGYNGKGSLIEWEVREGLNAKRPLIPFLPSQNRGGASVRRRRPDSGSLGDGGDRGERGKGEGREELRFPYLARAMVERGGGFTRAGGGGARQLWRRC
jgi:hypothetical protein